jgi:predicted nucleic acid-binding protein
MIVVVDTNIWISALHFSGSDGIPLRALHKAARVDTIATCEEIENEISIVLRCGSSGLRSRLPDLWQRR